MIEECAPTYLPSLHLTDDRLETSIVLQQVFGVLAHQRGFVTCVSIEEGFERSIQSILLCQKYNIEMYTRIARGELQLLQAKLRIERLEAEPEYAQDGDIAFFERFLLGLSLNAVDAALYSFWNWLLRNGVSSPTTSAFMLLNVAHYTMVPPGLMCALHAMENAYQQGALEDAEDLECTLQKWLDEHGKCSLRCIWRFC